MLIRSGDIFASFQLHLGKNVRLTSPWEGQGGAGDTEGVQVIPISDGFHLEPVLDDFLNVPAEFCGVDF